MSEFPVEYKRESDVRSMSELLEISAVTLSAFVLTDEDGEPTKVIMPGMIIADEQSVKDVVESFELPHRRKPAKIQRMTKVTVGA